MTQGAPTLWQRQEAEFITAIYKELERSPLFPNLKPNSFIVLAEQPGSRTLVSLSVGIPFEVFQKHTITSNRTSILIHNNICFSFPFSPSAGEVQAA